MAKLSSVAINTATARMISNEIRLWLPRLRHIYTDTHPLSIHFVGNAPSKNIAYRRKLNGDWKRASRSKIFADKFDIADTYIRKWGGLVANKDATIRNYASTPDIQLINRGAKGIASWSKLLSVRNPRRYPIYDARVAFSLNALQAMTIGSIDHWFHVPSTRITWIDSHLAALQALCSSHAIVPDAEAYKFYLDWYDEMGVNHRIQRVEMLLFAVAPIIAEELTKLSAGGLATYSVPSLLPSVRAILAV